jgi:hypothetical protein
MVVVMWEALKAVAVSTITMWRGVPSAINDMADVWTEDALDHNWPSVWGNQIKTFFWWIALATFVIGYILSAYLTVFLVHWLIF